MTFTDLVRTDTGTNAKRGTGAFAYRPVEPLGEEALARLDAWWRTANYLSVGQIYLLDNPLLREPLTRDHIKPRLLGHWGTTPGLNFLYAHLNRAIGERGLSTIFVTGPGHGGPGMVANAYLDGTYSEVYPHIGRDGDGVRKLFRQFSFPGGIPSHVAPETPGSIHEGGELGYALSHAYGAAFDNPDLLASIHRCPWLRGLREVAEASRRGGRGGAAGLAARDVPLRVPARAGVGWSDWRAQPRGGARV